MSLSQNISQRRKALKLSQEYVASQLGVSRQAVSKWESGQTEPTAKNLVELARLFDMTVSELVEPEVCAAAASDTPKKNLKLGFSRFAVNGYTCSVIMSTIETNDPGYFIFTSMLILFFAVWMAVNIQLLPRQIRLKTALWELAYCITVYCIAAFLEPLIRNVYASVLIAVCCVVYMRYIRFPEETKTGAA